VRDDTAYPAVLLHTGANDPRVAPWMIAKMAASSSGKPILLDVDYDAGHGIGSQRAEAKAVGGPDGIRPVAIRGRGLSAEMSARSGRPFRVGNARSDKRVNRSDSPFRRFE
jgi:hypothetical protein